MNIISKTTLFFIIFIACTQGIIYAGNNKSEKIKPRWISHLPTASSSNNTYYFKVVYIESNTDLASSRLLAKNELINMVERDEKVKIKESSEENLAEQTKNNKTSIESSFIYSLQVESEGQPIFINYMKVDEYWEVAYEKGHRRLKLYTLYAVAKKGVTPIFDEVKFSNKYGIDGFARSMIVPGWGQIYKGSSAKGGIILGGEVLLAGGIILSESMRASYTKKMREQPEHIKHYNTKADNWENARNICIGGAIALYVYNLIDVITTNGAKKTTVKKQRNHFSLNPTLSEDQFGMSLSFNF